MTAVPRCGSLLLTIACLGACAVPPATSAIGVETSKAPAKNLSKKRVEPEPVEPVVIGTVRYEALPSGKARGLSQDGGVIVAIDQASGAELWLLKIYEIKPDSSIEADKQEIFIARLTAAPDGQSLLVETERGRHYRVNLQTRAVAIEPERNSSQ
ncbi:hypothetical protein [Methylomonas albis]|uniref:Uncharacterized protein n=1 Tax=Methylomonas albis TaxID=1854563 RepID=A0ABR9D4M8_9GAMM|nr:hypothetical protein [Methylomonas albis]MBD9358063.1 hypothetical protein [Methylomonas albis]